MPGAALCYVHALNTEAGTVAPNAYSDRIQMLVVADGPVQRDEWFEFERDVIADYEAAFGESAPRIVGIALAADTDDTGETSVAYFGDVRLETAAATERR